MSETVQNKPLIVGFVANLMLTTKIDAAAQAAGFAMKWVEDETAVGQARIVAQPESPGEQLSGRVGRVFEAITTWQPVMLLFDLGNEQIPWAQWIPALKSSPATRRIPIVCFGPHEEVDLMKEAKRVGANYVFARSAFFAETAVLLQKHARVPNYDALRDSCAEPLPALAIEGLELFNQGEFYKCHDALEEAWRADNSPARNLYKGVLQVGIAYFQIQRGNYRGAIKMLLRVHQWLDPLPDVCRGIQVASLREDARAVQEALSALGPDRVAEFDQSLFRPVQYDA